MRFRLQPVVAANRHAMWWRGPRAYPPAACPRPALRPPVSPAALDLVPPVRLGRACAAVRGSRTASLKGRRWHGLHHQHRHHRQTTRGRAPIVAVWGLTGSAPSSYGGAARRCKELLATLAGPSCPRGPRGRAVQRVQRTGRQPHSARHSATPP